jgi:lysozyme
MKISRKGITLIKLYEGLRLNAYKCAAGVDTIGFGSTYYPDGSKVKLGDKLKDEAEAEELLKITLLQFEKKVNALLNKTKVNQNQFDALVSFAFNLGAGALAKSTLLKKVKSNPNDISIKDEFMKWVKAGGKTLKGLVKRRQEEANLYFS